MNRTRLAQLTAVLGAAVLLVLAVAVTQMGTTTVAGPELDQVATQAPAESGGPQDPVGDEGDVPVVGPTATEPAQPVPPAGDDAPAGDAPAGSSTATTPPWTGAGPLPAGEPTNPFGPTATSSPTATPAAPAEEEPTSAGEEPTPAEPAAPPAPPASESGEPSPPAPGPTPADPAPEEAPAPAAPPAPRTEPLPEAEGGAAVEHLVVRGDTLWDIAEASLGPQADDAEVLVAVEQLYQLNRDVIGGDPDLIFPGQVLQLPAW